ncbi:tectonic-1 isoform X3 [Sphaerodactylus townsendi]|nr:tectonic-1 isoform X3 [Sphaerodactylus townsendi]
MGPGAAPRSPPPPLLRPLALCLLVLPLPVAPTTAVPTPTPSVWATNPDGAATGPQPEGFSSTTPTPGVSYPAPETSQGPSSESSPSISSPAETLGPSPAGTRGPPTPQEPTSTPRPGPWPQPVTDVAKLCTCDLLVDQCDINCCCDPICTAADFSLFTTCSVPVVTGDRQLCRQQEALYSIDTSAHPPQRTHQLADKVNPSVFCIQTVNYKAALSFQPPEIPTSENFDGLLQNYGGVTFSTEVDVASSVESTTRSAADANETSRYEYRDPIQTADGFLWIPAPLFFSQCADTNPAGFLINQAVKCVRKIEANECATTPALSMEFYTNSSILAVPKSSQRVNITIQSITLQNLQGLRTRLENSAVLLPTLQGQMCSNVVLETMNEDGQLTMLKSTSAQDCLAVEGIRTPVLFGYNMISGCQLRITRDANCLLLAPALLNVLKGQNFPDCVASFGNSEPQNGLDWVQVVYNVSQPSSCEIPVWFEILVKWTKYGSLLNPQAKLTSLTVTVVTAPLPQVDSGTGKTIPILSAVTFLDVSAPAEPGYKSPPTVEAKLPFDFFFPFV